MKKIMFIPSHFPQSEMFRPIADELLKIKHDILIQLVDVHPQHHGITAFDLTAPYIKIIPMQYGYGFLELSYNKYIPLRLDYYRNFKKRLSMAHQEVCKLLNEEVPNLIVLGHDTMPLHKVFINEASKRGISTLIVQEGVISRYKNMNFHWTFSGKIENSVRKFLEKLRRTVFPLTHQERYFHGGCTTIAVWGNYIKNLLISEGISPSKIVITGSPRYDKLISIKPDKRKIYQELGISRGERIILYIDQRLIQNRIFTKREAYIYNKNIFEAAMHVPNIQLVVKLREGPGKETSLELTNKIIEDINADSIIVTDRYLYELLALAEVVIILFSTVGLEAIASDKPVISINFAGFEPYPYVESGAVLGCSSSSQILPTIQKVLFDRYTKEKLAEKRKNFIYDHLYKQDSQASKRVADLIFQMINN